MGFGSQNFIGRRRQCGKRPTYEKDHVLSGEWTWALLVLSLYEQHGECNLHSFKLFCLPEVHLFAEKSILHHVSTCLTNFQIEERKRSNEVTCSWNTVEKCKTQKRLQSYWQHVVGFSVYLWFTLFGKCCMLLPMSSTIYILTRSCTMWNSAKLSRSSCQPIERQMNVRSALMVLTKCLRSVLQSLSNVGKCFPIFWSGKRECAGLEVEVQRRSRCSGSEATAVARTAEAGAETKAVRRRISEANARAGTAVTKIWAAETDGGQVVGNVGGAI